MNDKYIEAISFANNYFALVDGFAYGLEEHLAEDVNLNWFGKIVNGKRNVAAFMRINMTNSRHTFHEIKPALSSGQRKKKKYKSKKYPDKVDTASDSVIQNGLNFANLCINDSSYGMDDNEMLDIKSTSVVPERNSDEIISENSMRQDTDAKGSSIQLISKMKCESSLLSSTPENLGINFVKANGIVYIHRSTGPNKIRKWQSSTFVSGLPGQTCRRHCKLQVAYSRRNEETPRRDKNIAKSRKACGHMEKMIASSDCCTRENAREVETKITKGRKRLSSHEEENLEMIVGVDQTYDPFENFDLFDDKQKFLKCLETGLKPTFNFSSPKYIHNRLIFDCANSNDSPSEHSPASFKFNYLIHSLIYESFKSSSISEKFEDRKSLSDTEKNV